MMKSSTLNWLALCALLGGCGTAQVTGRRELGAAPDAKPAVIYVSDFSLDPAGIKAEPGLLPAPPRPPLPGGFLPPLPGTSKDPKVAARELVDAMSASLVKELNRGGVQARRLPAGPALPASGWLVRGVFTEVNQGNQLTRAVIGFGAGKTDVQVLVDIHDLATGAPRPFFELQTDAGSGEAPGAGPMIVLGPAGAAARFVVAGQDLNRNVRQTASRIAAEVLQRAQPDLLTSNRNL